MVKFFEPDKGIVHSADNARKIPPEVLKRCIKVQPIDVNIDEGEMPIVRRRVGMVVASKSLLYAETPTFFSGTDHTLRAGSFDMSHASNKDLIQVTAVKYY